MMMFKFEGGDNMNVNEKLRDYLKERGITQQFVINKTGIERSRFNRIINGQIKITAEEISLIAKSLGVSSSIFLD